MCSMSVLCPLCAQTSFGSIDALRVSLIKAANEQLPCPICHELFWGLDKLTIHLFSHTGLMTAAAAVAAAATTTTTAEMKSLVADQQAPTTKTTNNSAGVVNMPAKAPSKEKKTKKLKQLPAENFKEHTHQHLNSPPQQVVVNNISNNELVSAIATCDICELTFRNADLRDMHIRLVHQNLNSPPCPDVANLMPNSTANTTTTSVAITNEPDFKCHLCAKTFKMKGSLRVHLKVVHLMGLSHVNNSPKLSICDRIRHKEAKAGTKINATQSAVNSGNSPQQQLAVTVNSPQVLTQALTLGNLTLLPSPTTSSAVDTNGDMLNINANGELVQCVAAAANDDDALNSNVLLVFNAANYASMSPSAELENIDALAKSSITSSIDNPKIWDCDVCSKSFTTKYFLKKHKRLHTGEMPYTCEICARTFTFQQSYHKHLLYHSDEKPHVCATCGRCFKELSTLHNHERIHSGEKPFACEVCGKCFRQRVSFLVHTRIHTGVMPYKCEVCQKCFRYKVSQRTHKCLPKLLPDAEDGAGGVADGGNVDEDENVDQISENFIKAFLESTSVHLGGGGGAAGESHNSPASAEIAAITGDCGDGSDEMDSKTVLDEALLSKAIDDIVVESCHKMGIGSDETVVTTAAAAMETHFSPSPCHLNSFVAHDFSDGSNSPSQKLQNMRLYSSPQLVGAEMEGVGESGFPRFLFDDVASHLL